MEIQDTDKNLYIRWRPRSNLGKDGSPEFVIGERVSINLEDFSYPRYMYNISGMFCMTETVEEIIAQAITMIGIMLMLSTVQISKKSPLIP